MIRVPQKQVGGQEACMLGRVSREELLEKTFWSRSMMDEKEQLCTESGSKTSGQDTVGANPLAWKRTWRVQGMEDL